MIWRALKRLLFLFDAEWIHHLAVRALLLLHRVSPSGVRLLAGIRVPGALEESERTYIVRLWGMEFLSPVGLAAGFDKDGRLLRILPDLGFGFAEVGTVTPRPQPGNPRPRLFRDHARLSLFNRMGFNSAGARAVAENIRSARSALPPHFRVGINIGKNRDTPLERAFEDYRDAVKPFRGLVDYIVVNLSSPNTPGLRSLQSVEAIQPIVAAVTAEISSWPTNAPPILVKLAPEIGSVELQNILMAGSQMGISGWILTNTRVGEYHGVSGGWSGACLTEISREKLLLARTVSKAPIVSVGGVMDATEGRLRRRSGADLVQLYSGWIFAGPRLPGQVARMWMIP